MLKKVKMAYCRNCKSVQFIYGNNKNCIFCGFFMRDIKKM